MPTVLTSYIHDPAEPGLIQAPFVMKGHFYRGRRVLVEIVRITADADIPLAVREALVGARVSAVFTVEQLIKQKAHLPGPLSPGSRLCYVTEVADVLENTGKHEEAQVLRQTQAGELDMLILEEADCRVVDQKTAIHS
jgi:hypothetical protein